MSFLWFFLLFSSTNKYFQRCFIIYLTLITFLSTYFDLECNHVQSVNIIMPVITRSQTRRSTGISNESLKVVSPGSSIILSDISSAPVSSFPNNTLTDAINSIMTLTLDLPLDRLRSDSCHCSWNSSISKFENLEVSKSGLSLNSEQYCHNLSVSKTLIMEVD
jgi:hypothetical protein